MFLFTLLHHRLSLRRAAAALPDQKEWHRILLHVMSRLYAVPAFLAHQQSWHVPGPVRGCLAGHGHTKPWCMKEFLGIIPNIIKTKIKRNDIKLLLTNYVYALRILQPQPVSSRRRNGTYKVAAEASAKNKRSWRKTRWRRPDSDSRTHSDGPAEELSAA